LDTGTRRTILDMLKRDGPRDATAMAASLGVSPMAVRQHLYALNEEGLVAATEAAGRVGRPRKLWGLTDAADAFFPSGYADLTAGLMAGLREAFGEAGIEKIVAVRTRQQIETYRDRMAGAATLADRLALLADIRTEEGYMAAATNDGDGFLFVENHCPICAAARSCTALCRGELELFEAVLGPGATVSRTEHIPLGARRCAYRVTAA